MKPDFALLLCILIFSTGLALESHGQNKVSTIDSNWPQWKGAKKNNKSSSVDILKNWSKDGPKLLWKSEGLGNGHSNLSFYGKYIYTMGDIDGKSCLLSLNRSSGKIVWKAEVGAAGGSYAGPRSTPATDGELVFGYSQFGDLLCANALTGNPVWKLNFQKDLSSRQQISKLDGKTSWGVAESPFLFRDAIYMVPGGNKGAVVALDKYTGKVL